MSATSEIKRKVELWLCSELATALPAVRFVPAKGGDDTTDASDLVPHYCFIECTHTEKTMPGEPTYLVEVSVTYVTHMDDTPSAQHSATVRLINDQIALLERGFDPGQELMVHGTDISRTDEVEDAARQSHGDVILVTVGCSG